MNASKATTIRRGWANSLATCVVMNEARPEGDIFEIYFDDDRYGVPTLHLISADRDLSLALVTVKQMLEDNAHYRGAELWRAGQRLAGLGSMAAPEDEADAT